MAFLYFAATENPAIGTGNKRGFAPFSVKCPAVLLWLHIPKNARGSWRPIHLLCVMFDAIVTRGPCGGDVQALLFEKASSPLAPLFKYIHPFFSA